MTPPAKHPIRELFSNGHELRGTPGDQGLTGLPLSPADCWGNSSRRCYVADEPAATDAFNEAWIWGDEEIALHFLLSEGQDPLPLVFYPPGLGEPVEAGLNWGMAWAQGGYAIVSRQTTKVAALWANEAGRSGDFFKVARDEFLTAGRNG